MEFLTAQRLDYKLLAHVGNFAAEGDIRHEPLIDHLRLTGRLAAGFASASGLARTAELLGRIHDLGKASSEFQAYIRAVGDSDETEDGNSAGQKGPDHSTAGARWLLSRVEFPPGVGGLLGYAVAGHHAGLPDGRSASHACEEFRMTKKSICEWEQTAMEVLPPEFLKVDGRAVVSELAQTGLQDELALAGRIRMVFSALVDADFLATERFVDADRAQARTVGAHDIEALERRLNAYLERFDADCPRTSVNDIRHGIRAACLGAAEQKPGLFTLEVPTGGGKTLSSMAFALKHARIHGLRRVVYVIPYTSIIEQNAEVFRRIFGDDVVLEHHANRDPEYMGERARLLTENWDAPIIVTTNVQFFESLYSNRPSRCRKLHNLAKSVIVLDEAQSLPAPFLRPCLHALDELMCNAGSSVVICTATVPAFFKGDMRPVGRRGQSWDGLSGTREGRRDIVDGRALERDLNRVAVTRVEGRLSDDELAAWVGRESSALVIVSTRRHARRIYENLKNVAGGDGVFHLSAQMCPAHRLEVLEKVKARLGDGMRCLLVSTQLIEAGVDVDFPCVYREIAGCDSMVQAAGRCNREGRLESGRVILFESSEPHSVPRGELTAAADKGREVVSLPEFRDSALSSQAVRRYFQLRYNDLDAVGGLDARDIEGKFTCTGDDPYGLAFKSCAEAFKLIPDDGLTVYVPYGERGRALCEQLRATYAIGEIKKIVRLLGRYSVSIHGCMPCDQDGRPYAELVHDRYWVVTSPELNYSPEFGLTTEPVEQLLEI